jgi:N-acetylglucosamine repressor
VNLEWQDLPLSQLLEKKYKLPVLVLNDSQAAAIGEYVYGGDHAPDENLIVVNVIRGIGAGILINGRLFQGDGGGAGEIGHVVVQENGELCRCGKRGCLETIASARAVIQQMKMDSLEDVISSFQNGNSNSNAVVEKAGHYLGVALANVIGTLNIQKIVLTGDMTRFGEKWLNTVSASMQTGALSRMAEDTKLEIGKLDYRACILGASAFLLLDDYSLLFSEEN